MKPHPSTPASHTCSSSANSDTVKERQCQTVFSMTAIKTHFYLQNDKLQRPSTIILYPFTQEQKHFILRPIPSMNLSSTCTVSICFAHMYSKSRYHRLDIYEFNFLKNIFLKHSPFHFDDTDSFLLPKETIK